MNPLQLIQNLFKYLSRTQITGAEAEEFLQCRNWLISVARQLEEAEANKQKPPSPPQPADPAGK